MTYTVYQLRPPKPVLIIGTMELEFDLLTLHRTVKLQELYGELPEIMKLIEQDKTKLLDIFWHLLLDKSIFNFNQMEFKNYLMTGDLTKLGAMLYKEFTEIIQKSMPLVINKKRMEEIQKVRSKEINFVPNYAKYFDIVSKRYSYSLDQFYELTLRQLTILLETVDNESYEELAVQASLAGKKLKPKIQYNHVTPEEEKENEQEAQDAVARLKAEYLRNNNKDK